MLGLPPANHLPCCRLSAAGRRLWILYCGGGPRCRARIRRERASRGGLAGAVVRQDRAGQVGCGRCGGAGRSGGGGSSQHAAIRASNSLRTRSSSQQTRSRKASSNKMSASRTGPARTSAPASTPTPAIAPVVTIAGATAEPVLALLLVLVVVLGIVLTLTFATFATPRLTSRPRYPDPVTVAPG